MSRPTICLASMVKQEHHILKRMIDSAKPYIDAWCFLDTGSTDGTQGLIEELLSDVPGELHEEPFVNFCVSRNRLLELAREQDCDYLLLLDADHILIVEDGSLDALEADSYLVRLNGPLTYLMPYIVKSEKPFRYIGVTHEYLGCDGGFWQEPLPGVSLDHLGDGGMRHEKFDRDLRLLEEDYEIDPANERTMFYLAQTLQGVGEVERSIEMYRKRFEAGGWDEERGWALFQIAEMTHDVEDYLKAWNFRPSRLESIQRLAKHFNETGQHHVSYLLCDQVMNTPPTNDWLFVESWVYTWGLLLEHGLACYYTGRVDEAKIMFEIMLARELPDDIRELTKSNLAFC